MAENQYVRIRLCAENLMLGINTAQLSSGKFHEPENKSKEIESAEIESTILNSGEQKFICACGRSSAAVGTSGFIELIDKENEKILGKYIWASPWSGKNISKWEYPDSKESDIKDYYTIFCDPETPKGPLGNINLIIIKK